MVSVEHFDIKVLIIDDEEKLCERLYKMVSKNNYCAERTTSSVTALKMLKEKQYDLVITDIRMPEVTGFEILKFIHESQPDCLTIILTGYASVEGAIEAIQNGAYDFIQKPISPQNLQLILNRATENIYLRRENQKQIEELQALNKLKDDFIAVVSHDLRSPLSSIGEHINYILRKGDLNEKQEKYLNAVLDINQNLYDLVTELLDLSRFEKGAIALAKEEVNISEIFEICKQNFEILCKQKNNQLIFKCEISEPIQADHLKIQQVINNLIVNAIKFTENGSITVKAYSDQEKIYLEIIDTGIGISADEQEQIFDKYKVFYKHGTQGEKGSGLGLIICKNIVDLHGGKLLLNSKVNEGSTFTILLPRT